MSPSSIFAEGFAPHVSKAPKGPSNPDTFCPVSEEEFQSVSSLVRGRAKLDEVNQVCFRKAGFMEGCNACLLLMGLFTVSFYFLCFSLSLANGFVQFCRSTLSQTILAVPSLSIDLSISLSVCLSVPPSISLSICSSLSGSLGILIVTIWAGRISECDLVLPVFYTSCHMLLLV